MKERSGVVDNLVQKASPLVTEVLVRDMFAKDIDWQVYIGPAVLFEETKRLGRIIGPFGKNGKFRVELVGSPANQSVPAPGEKIVLRFIKLVTLRPLKRVVGAAANSGKKNQSPSTASNGKKDARKLLQDDRILYPEAFLSAVVSVQDESSLINSEPQPSPNPELLAKEPCASGVIERLKGETTVDGRNPFVIVTGLFGDEAAAAAASGLSVRCFLSLHPGCSELGKIEKPFGKGGKVRVVFKDQGGTLGQVGDAIELLE